MVIDLPVWEGVKPTRVANKIMPFSLCVSDSGLIIQNTPNNIKNDVIKKYSDDNYNYITTEPGKSDFNVVGIRNRIKKLKSLAGLLEGLNVIEIGGGNDYMANIVLEEEGVENYMVVDPSIRVESTNKKLTIIREYFDKNLISSKFDMAICISCLEHVPDAVSFLEDLREVLRDDNSKAIVFFPIVDDQFKNGDINSIVHEHISYFTKESAVVILESVGFKIESSEFSNDGGWFCLSRSEVKCYNKNSIIGSQKSLLIQFENKLTENIKKFSEYLKRNDDFIFFGACNGINSLLGLNDVHNKKITIIDSDQSKSNGYISSVENPIISKEEYIFDKSKRVVVSSNSFYNQIRKDLVENFNVDEGDIVSVINI